MMRGFEGSAAKLPRTVAEMAGVTGMTETAKAAGGSAAKLPRTVAKMAGVMIVVAILGMVMTGCRSGKTVTVERIAEREKTLSVEVHDTTVVYDSTGVRVKGDTVFVDRWHTKMRTIVKHDTLRTETRDSIPYRVVVERKRTLAETAGEWIKGGVVGIGLVIGLFIIYKRWRKMKEPP
ncbi:MAG: hypothetical protein ACI4T5_03230 [Prevotella sp.]